jgi:hypothetical protein
MNLVARCIESNMIGIVYRKNKALQVGLPQELQVLLREKLKKAISSRRTRTLVVEHGWYANCECGERRFATKGSPVALHVQVGEGHGS